MNRPHFGMTGSHGNAMAESPVRKSHVPGGEADIVPDSRDALKRLLRQEQELSPQRLAELRAKVASGAYLTRGAAEITAARLLDDSLDLESTRPTQAPPPDFDEIH